MTYPPKPCLVCGKEFVDPKHLNRKYCSHACAIEAQRTRENKTCPTCGKQFTVNSGRKRIHCSPECAYKRRHETHAKPEKRSIFKCAWCGIEFKEWTYRKPRFCSNQCRSEYAARQPRPTARRPQNFVTITCETCGKPYSVHKAQVTGRSSRFCSAACRTTWTSEARKGSGNVNYRGGTIRYRGANWGRQKRAALTRDGYKCQICGKRLGKHRWDYGVHHIKPYREFNDDYVKANELINLITLCRRCHGGVEAGNIACPRPLF